MLTQENVKEFAVNVSTNCWNWGLVEFCEATGFANDAYGQQKFLDFQELGKALNKFDVDMLCVLVNVPVEDSVKKL